MLSEDKRRFLKNLEKAWKAWNSAYSEAVGTSGRHGDRSLKDIIAHVTWAVLETNGMLAAKALVGSDLWLLSEDERNEIVYRENMDRALDDVVQEAEAAQRDLVTAVEGISNHDLFNADWFAALPGTFPPARVIQVNVIDHYLHHTQDARFFAEQ